MPPRAQPVAAAFRVVVDLCEPKALEKLFGEIGMLPSQVIRRRLDVGDFHVQIAKGHDNASETIPDAMWTTRLIVERKTFVDLTASLRDKRLFEQNARLRANAPSETQVAILLETATIPSMNSTTGKMLNKCAYAALLKLCVQRQTHLLVSRDVQQTAWTLWWSAKRLAETAEEEPPVGGSDEHFVHVHASKSANVTPRVAWRNMLSCVPGVGFEAAQSVAARFRDAAHAVSTPDFVAVVAELSTNKNRRIGPKTARRIASFLGMCDHEADVEAESFGKALPKLFTEDRETKRAKTSS